MCGRFTRKENFQQIAEQLGLKSLPTLSPRYNIAPSQLVACVRTNPETKEREFKELKWGLVPSWAKDPSIGNKMINARAETVAEKPSFRQVRLSPKIIQPSLKRTTSHATFISATPPGLGYGVGINAIYPRL